MRFLQLITEANIAPDDIPDFEEFAEEWESEIREVFYQKNPDATEFDLSSYTEEHFNQLIARLNAVNLKKLYRGVVLTWGEIEGLRPGMNLGKSWTWDLTVAEGFANGRGMAAYDERFFNKPTSTTGHRRGEFCVIMCGSVKPSSVDWYETLGMAIDEGEYEIVVDEDEPIRLHSLMYYPYPRLRDQTGHEIITSCAGLYRA